MISKLRENLLATGCTNEKLIRKLESEWGKLDALNPKGDIAKMVVECGRDFGRLAKYFISTFGLSQNSAGRLTRIFGNKAAAQLSRDRQLKPGITVGRWRYSGAGAAPCTHTTLNNKYFFLRKGAKFNGRYILPGEEVGCLCSWAPVIPGFIDDRPPEKLLDKIKRLLGLNQN